LCASVYKNFGANIERHGARINYVSKETTRNTCAYCGYPLVKKDDVYGAVVAALLLATLGCFN